MVGISSCDNINNKIGSFRKILHDATCTEQCIKICYVASMLPVFFWLRHTVSGVFIHQNVVNIFLTGKSGNALGVTSDNDEFFSCHETFVNDDKTASITSFPSWSDAESWPDALDVECIIGPSTEGLDRLEGRPSMLYGLHPGEWPTWMHLEGAVQQLLVMFISAHDLQEALDAGVDPYKCFEFYAEGNCIEATDTICNHPDWRFPHQFSVTRNQLEDLGWGAPDIIQAEWNSWVNAPTLEEWGSGFPESDVPDRYHPA